MKRRPGGGREEEEEEKGKGREGKEEGRMLKIILFLICMSFNSPIVLFGCYG